MKQIWPFNLLLSFCLLNFSSWAQKTDSSSWLKQPNLTLSGFAEAFYVQDFNRPQQNFRQNFLFNHNRHQEVNLNLGLISLELEHDKYRANLAFHAGTYVNDNYSAEPEVLKNIFQANVGLALNRSNTLWLDLGILPSHIGFETAIGIENWTLTRSLLAENSPYFFAGSKLSYLPNQTWEMALVFMNGWQRIQRLSGNSLPSLGTQITFKPKTNLSFNWSTFIGTDEPDSTRKMRYFNNLYAQSNLNNRLGLILGFDFGVQQQQANSSNYDLWLSPVLIMQLQLKPNWKTALRLEYYQDKAQVMINTQQPHGFDALGLSFNLDYTPIPALIARLETRYLRSSNPIFQTPNRLVSDNFFISASIGLRFSELLNK